MSTACSTASYAPLGVIQGDGVGVGHHLRLETHLIVREDSLTLYGFRSVADVEWFGRC